MHKERNAYRHKCSSTASSARPDFTSQLAWEEIDAISGGAGSLCVLHTSAIVKHGTTRAIVPLLNGVKSRGSVVEKNRKGAIFLRPTLATRLPRVEKCFPRFPAAAVLVEVCFSVADTLLLLLAGDLKKVEFTATTNGLNSQLSLDKLKTNSCSLSEQMGGGRVVSKFSPWWTLGESQP